MYESFFTKEFKRNRKKLRKNHDLQKEFKTKLPEILKKPQNNKNLRNVLAGELRFHLQKRSFVVKYEIDEKLKKVNFLEMSHHDKAYKPMKAKKISRVQRLKQRKLVKTKIKVL